MEPPTIEEPWKANFLEDLDYQFSMDKGVCQVFSKESGTYQRKDFHYPLLSEFVSDMQLMCAMIADGPL